MVSARLCIDRCLVWIFTAPIVALALIVFALITPIFAAYSHGRSPQSWSKGTYVWLSSGPSGETTGAAFNLHQASRWFAICTHLPIDLVWGLGFATNFTLSIDLQQIVHHQLTLFRALSFDPLSMLVYKSIFHARLSIYLSYLCVNLAFIPMCQSSFHNHFYQSYLHTHVSVQLSYPGVDPTFTPMCQSSICSYASFQLSWSFINPTASQLTSPIHARINSTLSFRVFEKEQNKGILPCIMRLSFIRWGSTRAHKGWW